MSRGKSTLDQLVEIAVAEIELPVKDRIGLRLRAISALLRFEKEDRAIKALRALLVDPSFHIRRRARSTILRITHAKISSD